MRSFVDAKKFRRMAKHKRSDDMDLEDDRSVKEELLSGLQGQETSFPKETSS